MHKEQVQLFCWLHLYFPKHKFSNSFTCFKWEIKDPQSVNHSVFLVTLIEMLQSSQRNWPSTIVNELIPFKHSIAFPSAIPWLKIIAFQATINVWFCVWSGGRNFCFQLHFNNSMLNISQAGSQNVQKSTTNMSQGGNKCKISYK